jgi:hypothetical protein
MNFDNFISVTCICVGILEILSLHLDMKMVEQVACINNRKTVFAEFLSNSIFLLGLHMLLLNRLDELVIAEL